MNNLTIEEILEKTEDIRKLSTEGEQLAFYNYANQVPENGIIVDIGTSSGGSAFIFALASKPSVKVYTIDPNKSDAFIDKLDSLGLKNKLIFINKMSKDASEDIDKEIDLLFVDGVHSYHGVKNDYLSFEEKIKIGGIVMFHDYYLYGNTIGQAVDELEKEGKIEKINIVDSLYKKEMRVGLYISKKIK